MDRGYVKLWRKSIDSGLLQNPDLWSFWCWCLLKASYRPHKQSVGMQIVELEPGQFIFGRQAAARELKTTERKIRTCVHKLKNLQNLTIKTTNKFSIISIINWDAYQDNGIENDQQNDQQVTSKRPASDHKQEGKEGKNNILPKGSMSKQKISTPVCPHDEIRKLYNEILPELPLCTERNQTFDGYLKSRWRENKERQTLEWWESFFKNIRNMDFLMGRTEKPFFCNLDWMVKPTNFTKILNGNYQNKKKIGLSLEKRAF